MSAQPQHKITVPAPRPRSILRWVKELPWRGAGAQWLWLHPCAISQHRYLVHHPQLRMLAPNYFRHLQAHAQAHGWRLRPCRRATATTAAQKDRRERWVPLLLLSCALSVPEAYAAPMDQQVQVKPQQLQAFSNEPAHTSATERPTTYPMLTNETPGAHVDQQAERRIHSLLRERWHAQRDDPPQISRDLRLMATYYSQFPAVVALFNRLAQYEWRMGYAEKTFATQVSGSRLRVNKVHILFDPRSAAQFKFHDACTDKISHCFASPADVLLHELLHANRVLSNPPQFLSEGGMSSVMYPYEHERQTLLDEKRLYVSMSAIDKAPRPLRTEHTGRHVQAACATCLN